MKISKAEGLQKLAGSGHLFLEVFQHGTLSVEVYQPIEIDHQQPHDRDEVYIIIAGQGHFLVGNEKYTFQPGDFLFVPAGVVHRFEDFSSDFSTWVLFYGPVGGESEIIAQQID